MAAKNTYSEKKMELEINHLVTELRNAVIQENDQLPTSAM